MDDIEDKGKEPSPAPSTAAVAIKALVGVVFLGWILIWIMMPTYTYKVKWTPKMNEATDSTYFQSQGVNLLVYTFPILFISVLGCVYLHLELKRNRSSNFCRRKSERLAVWRRPLLVRGPLGIVSAMEVAFFVMFIALLVWSLWMYTRVSFDHMGDGPQKAGQKVWEYKLMLVAHRVAFVGNICLVFLFFPVTRGSTLLPLVGLTSEAAIRYHIWIGHLVMVLETTHSILEFVYWISLGKFSTNFVQWKNVGVSNVAGELSLLFGLVLWATTFPKIRRRMFELFYYTHHFYILFLIFFLYHVGIGYVCQFLPGFYLFMLDRYLRFLQSRQKVRLLSTRLLPGDTVELNFSKNPGFHYTAASVMFVNVPSVSKLQWHPFTVTSSSNLEPEKLSVIIKKEGSWTQKLYNVVSSPSPLDRLDVSVEGPYGPISNHFLSYDSLVLVSGGSGITPFISMIRELIHRSTTLNLPTPNVHLICAFRTSADLNMLDLLLPASPAGDTSDGSRLQLRIDAFVTRETAPTEEAKTPIRTIWFKPLPSDAPIYPVLGHNGWLWMAAIIGSSFVAYLVLLGILIRYYVYPKDQRSMNTHSSSHGHDMSSQFSAAARDTFSVLFICASIAAFAGAAVLWNKRVAATASEAGQVRVGDAPTPTASPGAWFVDRELESLPAESLVNATKVQYGVRPDLKKMLLECDEANTGVYVSGPTSMRREVAAVCGSGLADNLRFESVSFSW